MLFAVGTLGGGAFLLLTPQPSTRTMADLRDAGITLGQPVVTTCPERLTQRTKRRINAAQPGALRPRQSYARIARVARCFGSERLDGGLGNCIGPDGSSLAPFTRELIDGGLEPKTAEVIVPSLRRNLDADGGDDGGEDDVDDSFQYDVLACSLSRCSTFDAGDGTNFCQRLNRLRLIDSPCAIPNGWKNSLDGGWEESVPVDCRFSGPYGEADGGPRWRGFNVGPKEYSSGADCIPVECSVVSGDVPSEWL